MGTQSSLPQAHLCQSPSQGPELVRLFLCLETLHSPPRLRHTWANLPCPAFVKRLLSVPGHTRPLILSVAALVPPGKS